MREHTALQLLLEARTLKDAKRVVSILVGLGFVWMPLGAKEGNFGLVNIGSDPGFAFIERITNALDALIDEAARRAPPPVVAELSSPRAAVAALFAIPEGRTIHLAPERQAQLAREVTVTIGDGTVYARPLLEVRDSGTGLAPEAMPATILNLAGSNKIAKPYLAGAYGQGGSTTFAFSPDGTIVASATDESDVGITFVRYCELDAHKNKNGRYEYLSRPGDAGVGRIPRDAVTFARGTLVRHFDYDLAAYAGDARLPERSLLALIQTALFDPVLPFTIVENRARFRAARAVDADSVPLFTANTPQDEAAVLTDRPAATDELALEHVAVTDRAPAVAPKAPRAQRVPSAAESALPAAITYAGRFARLQRAGSDAVEYAQSVQIPLPPIGANNIATAHYWVLTAPDALLHPDPRHPIVMTHFGQTHGVEDRRLIVDALRLPFLKNDLVVQIELDGLSPGVKRELFSTTRDRLKRGSRYNALIEAIVEALGDDPQLQAANTRRRLRLLEKQQKTDYKKLRRRFAELIEKFRPGEEAAAQRNAAGTNGSVAAAGGSADAQGVDDVPLEPLPTLAHPTFLRIKRSDGPLRLRRARRTALVVESDAPNGYLAVHENARLVLVDPTLTSVRFLRTSDFRAGRARLSVRTDLPIESTGTIGARLTDATGSVFADEAPYLVIEPLAPQSAADDGASRVRVPEIYEIYAADWPRFAFTDASVAQAEESVDDYSLFVNMDNRHLRRLLTTTDYQAAGIARIKSSYLVQVAFYTFLLHEGRASNVGIDDGLLEGYQQRELDRVAQTVVTSIAAVERIDSAAPFDVE
jgi:hypothetical protein